MIKIFSFFLIIFSFHANAKKVLPAYLQKAYVIQKNAIIYTRPDFDSAQITNIPGGTKVTISKKIYRPKTRFGTFYRIYINKPKKLRAYISEVDVVPRYIKSGSTFKPNPAFKQVKKKIKHVKDFQFNSMDMDSADNLDINDKPLSQSRFIGMIISHYWLAYQSQQNFSSALFFGLKVSGSNLPIKQLVTDVNLMFSLKPPVINQTRLRRGYILLGDFLFKLPLIEAPMFILQAGGGLMVRFNGSLPPDNTALSNVGAGIAGTVTFNMKIYDRFFFLFEGKSYYDISESKYIPALTGGLMVSF